MTKPLHEMEITEVLQLLTAAQRESVLAYARQFARSNSAVTLHGGNSSAPFDQSEQTVTESDTASLRVTPQAPTVAGRAWFIDGRNTEAKIQCSCRRCYT